MSNIFVNGGSTLTLLGYSSKREYFGNAVSFRQVNVYNYEYTVLDLENLSNYLAGTQNLSEVVQNEVKTQLGIFSGDANIVSFDFNASPALAEEQIRAGKYNFSVEVREPIKSVTDVLSSDESYDGIDYIRNNHIGLNNFTESFNFEQGESSRKFKHDISFELRSGGASLAKTIASDILKNEPEEFGSSILPGGLGDYSDSTSFNYYTESYDLFKNTFSFSKNKELYKGGAAGATIDISNTIEFSREGYLTIGESIKARGKQNFNQALVALNNEINNSPARCTTIFNNYQNFAGINSSLSLLTTPISVTKKYNIPSFEAEADQKFTSNPIYSSSVKKTQVLSLDRDEYGIYKVKNDYNFFSLSFINVSDFSQNLTTIMSSINALTEASAFYQSKVTNSATLSELNLTSRVSNRKKEFTLSYDYSDDPRYNVTVNGTLFKNLDISLDEKYPQDILKEYKVIGKSNTLINYGYQQSPGEKTVSYKAKRQRPATNQFDSFALPSSEILALHLDAIKRVQNSFGSTASLNYYLNKANYSVDNQNNVDYQFSVAYTRKKI